MAYNAYRPQQGQQAQYNNPYAQQQRQQQQAPSNGYTQQYTYGQGSYGQTHDVEMHPLPSSQQQQQQQQQQFASGNGPSANSHSILDRCRAIDSGIRELDHSVADLKMAQNSSLQESGQDAARGHRLDQLTAQILAQNRQLVGQISQLKATPGAGGPTTARQVQLVEDKLNTAFQAFQTAEADYRRKFTQQLVRQYRVVNPDATEQEARSAAQNPTGGVFAQALMNSDRRGEAQSTLSLVRNRHEAIQDVERQMIQLAELFDQMNRTVVAQEATVVHIDESTENVQQDVVKANDQLVGANKLARARNRKKWWCLLICILIIIAIVAIVAGYVCLGLHKCKN